MCAKPFSTKSLKRNQWTRWTLWTDSLSRRRSLWNSTQVPSASCLGLKGELARILCVRQPPMPVVAVCGYLRLPTFLGWTGSRSSSVRHEVNFVFACGPAWSQPKSVCQFQVLSPIASLSKKFVSSAQNHFVSFKISTPKKFCSFEIHLFSTNKSQFRRSASGESETPRSSATRKTWMQPLMQQSDI